MIVEGNTVLEPYLRSRLEKKDILLMTHVVLGYPSLEDSLRLIEIMVAAGVDLMELQIPFSEATADGPTIKRANEQALKGGITVKDCFRFIEIVTETYDIPFLIMSYYGIPLKYGVKNFIGAMSGCRLQGAIIPDLPQGQERCVYLDAMYDHNLAPILIFSPTISVEAMRDIDSFARGFIYCVARGGVTGEETDFSEKLTAFLIKCREATQLPLCLGFGVKEKTHIDFLKGKADIVVIGTQTIRVMEQRGIESVGKFIRSLLL